MKPGDYVWVVVANPVAARVGADAGDGRWWLVTCNMGTYLPQMYRESETTPLTEAACARLGLCKACLGFGTKVWPFPDWQHPQTGETMPGWFTAFQPDEGPERCAECGGSGRPGVRVVIQRDASGLIGYVEVDPHTYVPPLQSAMIQGCGICGEQPDHPNHTHTGDGEVAPVP